MGTQKAPRFQGHKSAINISSTLVDAMLKHAESSRDYEICGFIGGSKGIALNDYPIKNISPTPTTRYLMAPKEQINAFKLMRKRNEQLFAIYHSHPSGEALPSATDVAEVSYRQALQFIISMTHKDTTIRVFRLNSADEFCEVSLNIHELER